MFGSSFCLARAEKTLSCPTSSLLSLTAAEPGGRRSEEWPPQKSPEMWLPTIPVIPDWSMTPPGGRDCGRHCS